MRTKSKLALQPLTRVGGPAVGTVAALALGQDPARTVFVGARAGLFRTTAEPGAPPAAWERLANAPVGILALAVSPLFARDQRLVAGTNTGLYVSNDAGETWRTAGIPMSEAIITSVAFSPHFAQDAIVLAGTMEDGIYYSADEGEGFVAKSFGLLDASVLAIAFSPAFEHDATVFVGTETAAYFSYNGGLAWKELSFPASAAPVLSLALSPDFAADNTLYAGTEQSGLYRSTDRGESWQALPLPATTVNTVAQTGAELLAATEAGVFRSTDGGASWAAWLDLPNVIGLAASPAASVAGVVDQGVWLSADQQAWQALPGLSARSMLGLALAPDFDHEPVAFMYGPQEGLWRSTDGGATWASLADKLTSQDIAALALSPNFAQDHTVVVAALEGVSASFDGGDTWTSRADLPADLVAFSPSGQLMLVGFPVAGLRVSVNHGESWLPFPGPWDTGGKVAALAVSDTGQFYVAYLEGVGETVTLWKASPSSLPRRSACLWGATRSSRCMCPPEGPWYAAWGHQVFTLNPRAAGQGPVAAAVFDPDTLHESLTTLTGGLGPDGPVLLACTGHRVFKSADGQNWLPVFDFGHDRAVSLTLSPNFAADQTVYVLLLGGSMCTLTL